ncbi:hypothetical protein SAMN04488523_102398 [Sulfitobacter brevis]|uniref:Uncharacterized protein n=1 Tax=Sulfitobacter brevis TaxID=74348 RepID=A0A1I1V7K4_9RHOB|nr:hypothetical protein SAMN04488523_102398 [Sulfitobacter brevis]
MLKYFLYFTILAASFANTPTTGSAQDLDPVCQQNVRDLCGATDIGTCFQDGSMWSSVYNECVGDIQTMIEMDREFRIQQRNDAQSVRLNVLGYSYGGILRAGPGMNYGKIGSLAEGEQLFDLVDTGITFDGYSWFKVSTSIGEGYHWGGIFCTEGTRPANGVLAGCDNSPVQMAVFSCNVGSKTVSVTADNNGLTYTYGANGRTEKTITGGPRSGNLHWMQMRFAGLVSQLRFSSGEYSYIVFSAEGNGNTGAQAFSGLVVMQGTREISSKTCNRMTEFNPSFDYNSLPQDDERYSAM